MEREVNVKKHLNLGCAEPPIHPQHIIEMEKIAPLQEWGLVDLYVEHPAITRMDATTLEDVADASLNTIYASHLLEHISHRQIAAVLFTWRKKLVDGGILILNVPDLIWACRQTIKYDTGNFLEGVYDTFEGNNGLQSVFYGTHAHEGEYHKAGFTQRSLEELLTNVGFKDIVIERFVDAHDMGVLFSKCKK
jgi:hypothetical protein